MHDTGAERYHVGNSLCDEGKTVFRVYHRLSLQRQCLKACQS